MRHVVVTALLVYVAGCERATYVPARATAPYPYELHEAAGSIDVQVFRDGTVIEIVNSTPYGFEPADVWINQRFVLRGAAIPAGATVRLSLWDFYDQWGHVFSAGGMLRTEEPTPLRLVEIQPGPQEPLIGLVTIPAERPR
jgi:hypothetical protein